MKYYDLEAFANQQKNMEVLTIIHSVNDSYFLANIFQAIKEGDQIDGSFADILITFYEHFSGDKAQWLQHTMNIIYPFRDFPADVWIQGTLDDVLNSKELTPTQVVRRMIEDGTWPKNQKSKIVEIGKRNGFGTGISFYNRFRNYHLLK